MGGDIPARDNILAFNQVYCGRVGMVDTEHVLIAGNCVEGSLGDQAPVLQLRGKSEGSRISLNHLVRPPGSMPRKTLNISSRALISTLRGVDHTTDALIAPGHDRDTGSGPVTLTTTRTLPAGLTPAANSALRPYPSRHHAAWPTAYYYPPTAAVCRHWQVVA